MRRYSYVGAPLGCRRWDIRGLACHRNLTGALGMNAGLQPHRPDVRNEPKVTVHLRPSSDADAQEVIIAIFFTKRGSTVGGRKEERLATRYKLPSQTEARSGSFLLASQFMRMLRKSFDIIW